MLYIFIGCIGFVLFIIYDLNQIHGHKKQLRALFAIGFVLIIFATIMIIIGHVGTFPFPFYLRLIFGILAAINLWLLIYSLFFALPFKNTYISANNRNVCDRGMYALCRHPGWLWFALFYCFLWLCLGSMLMFWAFICFTASIR